jgi:hypothetical protein
MLFGQSAFASRGWLARTLLGNQTFRATKGQAVVPIS